MWKKAINIILIIILLAAGVWLRVANLGAVNFQNDEFFHVETAKGYLMTGQFVQWDYLNQAVKGEYLRAWPYTWLVAQSFRLLGTGELAGRLPSALFGILLLPLLYLITYKVTKSPLVALLVLILAVFDQSLIWSSRVCRMYSAFIFLYILGGYLFYLGWENKKVFKKILYLISSIIILLLAYLFHELTLLFFIGIFSYILINSLYSFFILKQKTWQANYVILLVLFCGLVLAGFIQFFVRPLVIDNYFALRQIPNWDYLVYPFSQLHFYQLGWLILILGVFLWTKWNKIKIYLLCSSVPVLIFFTFFAGRYPAKKYILFIIPWLLILYCDSLRKLVYKLFVQSRYKLIIIAIIYLLTGPIVSWPGLPQTGFTQLAKADENYTNFELHDFTTAYQYLADRYQAPEPVLIQGAQSYYMPPRDYNLISLGVNKDFSVTELKDYQQANLHGWVIWPKFKEYHLTKELVEYCKQNLQYQKDISQQTNIEIYYW